MKQNQLNIRVSDQELSTLKQFAIRDGMSLSKFVRHCCGLGDEVKPRPAKVRMTKSATTSKDSVPIPKQIPTPAPALPQAGPVVIPRVNPVIASIDEPQAQPAATQATCKTVPLTAPFGMS